MYTQDYDEMFPIGVNWALGISVPTMNWVGITQPYIKTYAVFGCPDDSEAFKPATQTWASAHGISYTANAYHFGYPTAGWDGPPRGPFGVAGANYPGGWIPDPDSATLAQMTRPADTVMVTEEFAKDTDNAAWISNGFDGWYGMVISNDIGGGSVNGYQLIPNGNNNPGAMVNGVDTAWPNGPTGAVSAHHSNKANFLLADGHVKTIAPVATNPDPNNHPELNMWDGMR
jgi:prepilin-type processing-associated H-X9-DG protein